jgi:hypothetical protein
LEAATRRISLLYKNVIFDDSEVVDDGQEKAMDGNLDEEGVGK